MFVVHSVVLNVVDMYTSTENTMIVVLFPYCTLIPFYKNIMSLSIRITTFPSYKFTTDYTSIRIILEFGFILNKKQESPGLSPQL